MATISAAVSAPSALAASRLRSPCSPPHISFVGCTHQAVGLPRLSSRARVQCTLGPVPVESASLILAAAGDVSAEGNTYLIAGAVAIALIGSAFPLLFSRKDTCPVCDGSGFVRSGARLAGNSARKDDARIVCQNCQGLGKINQVDK